MAEAKHTPGPWEHGNEAIKVMADRKKPWNGTVFQQGVEDQAAALVALTFGTTVDECVQAAILIAAAPDMLAALKNVAEGWGDHNEVLAAIAKATGAA